jgi:farnesyl diphosphate synthase
VTASQSDLGKTPGKDQAAGKATIVALLGVAGARARVADLVAQLEGEKGILGALPGWIARRSG